MASDLHRGHQGFGEEAEDLAQYDEEDYGKDHFGLEIFCHFREVKNVEDSVHCNKLVSFI